jgi:hypothetical protein
MTAALLILAGISVASFALAAFPLNTTEGEDHERS